MRRNLFYILTIVFTFLLQSTISIFLPASTARPNLLLILTVSMGFLRGKKTGLFTGFFSGLLVDLLYGNLFGLTALVYMYIGYLNGFLFKTFFEDDIRVPMISVGIFDFLYNIIVFIVGFAMRSRFHFGTYLKNTIIPEAVISVLFTILFYEIYMRINRKVAAKEMEEEQSPWLRR